MAQTALLGSESDWYRTCAERRPPEQADAQGGAGNGNRSGYARLPRADSGASRENSLPATSFTCLHAMAA